MSKKTVAIGLSGGVDSSVAALLLKNQGFHVIALFMKNWEEKDKNGICKSTQDFEDVARVCERLEIPYYSMNFVQEYWDRVFTEFIEGLKKGYTPNPDILCNREIKFKFFLEKAQAMGADYLATGHYAQILHQDHSCYLLKALDKNKDQSYFLHTLNQEILKKVLFPIGHLQKPHVRQIAKEHQLITHDKKDSTGICFIGKRDFKQFIQNYIPYQPGNFENLKGEIVGRHDGSAYYTIGQRKGLEIGGPGDAWFVVGKDMKRNVVIIEQGKDHPALYRTSLTAVAASWTSFLPPSPLPFKCSAKIRYRQEDQECLIEKIEGDRLFVTFATPQRAVTPWQSIVFYQGNICLGGAFIEPR